MARPYKDAVELSTEPVPRLRSRFTPEDAVIVKGVYSPGVPDAAPLVLAPGFEYRVRRVGAPHQAGEEPAGQVWVIEKRSAPRG